MLDILAVLDAAIDGLAPAAASRSTRGQAGPGCAAGTAKTLKSWGVPVVPTRAERGIPWSSQSLFFCEQSQKNRKRPRYEYPFFYGYYGYYGYL